MQSASDMEIQRDQQGFVIPSQPSPVAVSRKRSTVQREVDSRLEAAKEFTSHLPPTPIVHQVNAYIPPTLENAIFCGHLVTDLDSIAGALGAAELYGGIPARASEVNSETRFALDYWQVKEPEPIEEILVSHPHAGVCLVDHQQTSQLNKSIPLERIVGVIDHHALQNSTIVSDMPIYIDIRPWGSMSTIITHSFMMYQRRPSKPIAGMLLCAILSDTLNLQGPTTTEWDRLMVTVLTDIAGVEDITLLATEQFKAKSRELGTLGAHVLVTGDQKVFTFKTDTFTGSVGFAVIETTDDAVILDRAEELRESMIADKETKGLSMLYLAVVNIVSLRSRLLLISDDEARLATAAFPKAEMENFFTMDLGGLVSRKKDFVPAITRAVKDGFRTSVQARIKPSSSDVFDLSLVQDR
jgi:manganese-dependent inorganic pyrophosphatase